MWSVRTGSRLHFGLLSLPGPQEHAWPDRHNHLTLPARRFGGAGLMIDSPDILITASAATAWSAEGPLAHRALAFARLVVDGVARDCKGADVPPRRLVVERAPRAPARLGGGPPR